MIRRKIATVFAILCIVSGIEAQIPDDFIRIDASQIQGLKIVKENTFIESSLFGYMNGGAELYLEYSFDRMVMTEMSYKGNQINVEVYRMKDIEGAFGIYSATTFRCDKAEALTYYHCQNSYQVQICRGSYYLNIVNHSGAKVGLDAAREIAGQLIAQISGDDFDVTDYFPSEELPSEIQKLILVRGGIALDNKAYEYLYLLDDLEDYIAVIAEASEKVVLSIRFKHNAAIEKFFARQGLEIIPEAGVKTSLEKGSVWIDNNGHVIVNIDTP